VVYVGLLVWVSVCVVIGVYTLASHLLTLPAPATSDAVLHRGIAAHRRIDQRDRWLVLHVVFDECACSQRVLEHLLAVTPTPGVPERIVLVTEHPATTEGVVAAAKTRGFDVEVVVPDQLVDDYHIEAAPLLVIVDPHDDVRYVGGYTLRQQAADIRDRAVIAATLRGEAVTPLPTFGCAVGRSLKSKLDPLGLRRN